MKRFRLSAAGEEKACAFSVSSQNEKPVGPIRDQLELKRGLDVNWPKTPK
jgi:hypothetical protein